MPCGMTRHPAVRRPGAGRSRSALAPAALGIAVLFTAGCGATSASSAASPGSPGPSVSGAAAYLGCLRQHGVTMPTARPTARPTSGAGGGTAARGWIGAWIRIRAGHLLSYASEGALP